MSSIGDKKTHLEMFFEVLKYRLIFSYTNFQVAASIVAVLGCRGLHFLSNDKQGYAI